MSRELNVLKSNRKLTSILFSCLFFTLSSASASEVEIQTARGMAKVKQTPEKVIVMDVPAVDTLDILGVKPKGLPNSLYVDYLSHLEANAEKVGSLFEPDFETIHALQPDLVIVGGRSSRQYDSMVKVASTIDMTIWGEDLIGQTKARLMAYGKLFNKEAEAEKAKAAFDAKIAEAKQAIKGKGSALVILTNGPKISAYGASGRFGWLHVALDLPEAIENVEESTHGEAISFEFIRKVNPDWLLVIDRAAAIGTKGGGAKRTLDNALIHETKAWKSGQMVYLDPRNIYIASGGIQSMTNTMDELIKAFNAAK